MDALRKAGERKGREWKGKEGIERHREREKLGKKIKYYLLQGFIGLEHAEQQQECYENIMSYTAKENEEEVSSSPGRRKGHRH